MTHEPLQEGVRVPDVVFKTRVRDESLGGENPYRWQDVSSAEIFDGKTIVVFGLPGAFTPTCSSTHLPGFEKEYDAFKKLGVDEIYCLSVNDAFVMKKWADSLGVQNVKMLPDGNATFTEGMGMLVKKENLGFGSRSWRYSMLVTDGVIEKIFSEPGFGDNATEDPFGVSGAETLRSFIEGRTA
ncbi:MAG TPA: peroxiredoxin [Candidatus Paceibacterota bacterium]|nr:peroxiredoxin [Candidatus Paceibacterota bacterium]